MASFSTLPSGWLPWTANGLTAVVLASATLWSAAQRPEAPNSASGTLVARSAAAGQLVTSNKQAGPVADPTVVRTGAAAAVNPSAESHLLLRRPADGLLPVSYQPGAGPTAVTSR